MSKSFKVWLYVFCDTVLENPHFSAQNPLTDDTPLGYPRIPQVWPDFNLS